MVTETWDDNGEGVPGVIEATAVLMEWVALIIKMGMEWVRGRPSATAKGRSLLPRGPFRRSAAARSKGAGGRIG